MEDKPQQAKFQGCKWETHGRQVGDRQVKDKCETSGGAVGDNWETD